MSDDAAWWRHVAIQCTCVGTATTMPRHMKWTDTRSKKWCAMSATCSSRCPRRAAILIVASHLPPTFARRATSLTTGPKEIITIATSAEFVGSKATMSTCTATHAARALRPTITRASASSFMWTAPSAWKIYSIPLNHPMRFHADTPCTCTACRGAFNRIESDAPFVANPCFHPRLGPNTMNGWTHSLNSFQYRMTMRSS